MAQKRMFSLSVVDTDKFMDMSASAQALYFHLGMHGDDDGFVASPKKIARATGCNDDDLRLLASKGYVIPFESGVIVITDWTVNNTLKNDRYHETIYTAEKAALTQDDAGRYHFGTNMEAIWNQTGTNSEPNRNQTGTNLEPEHNITEHSLTKQSKESEADKPPTRSRFVPPTVDVVREYCQKMGYSVDPERFVDYYASKGWKVGKTPMKDWRAAVRNWERQDGNKPGNAVIMPPDILTV
jgi:hypothetical protein